MKPYTNKRFDFRRTARHAAAACILSVTGSAPSAAAESERVISAEIAAIVNKTMVHANRDDIQASLDLLLPLPERIDLTPYERATLYEMIGEYQFELDRPALAIEAFEKVRLSGGLLPHEDKNIEFIIAQLIIGNGQFQEGAERLERLVKGDDAPKRQHVELLVNAWVQSEDYERSLPWAEIWFESADPKQRRHYDLINFLYNHLGLQEKRLDMLSEMIGVWPQDKTLLRALMSELTRVDREEDAFEVAKLLYLRGGMSDETELVKLVQYYAFYDMPFQAADILETEMDSKRISRTPERMKQLGDLYILARERDRALAVYETIVETSDEVEFLTTLGHRFSETGACQKADIVLRRAGSQGHDKAKASLLVGSCYYDAAANHPNLSCDMSYAQRQTAPKTIARNAALEAFKRVSAESREKRNAEKWIQFIEAEKAAADRKCGFSSYQPVDLCFQKIKQAYDAAIFTGGFKLGDNSCQKYVADYDAEFRTFRAEK